MKDLKKLSIEELERKIDHYALRIGKFDFDLSLLEEVDHVVKEYSSRSVGFKEKMKAYKFRLLTLNVLKKNFKKAVK